jgi:phosphatidylglycerol:prolipoprotein diacylglycerol transferase
VSVPFKDLAENIKQGNIAFLINNGQVFYGGLIGGCLGAFIGAKIAKVKLTDFVDLVTPGIPLGHAFGRIGCFFAGCCYGRPFERPIGIEYHKPIGDAPVGVPLFPVQLLEAAINLIICMVLVLYTRKHNTKWKVFSLYLIMYSVGRYFLEYLRYDAIRGKLIGISTSQWISISLFVVGLILWRSRFAQESKATDSKAV